MCTKSRSQRQYWISISTMKDTTNMQYDKVNITRRRYWTAAINWQTYIEYRFLYIMSKYMKKWRISVVRRRQLNTKSPTIKHGCPCRSEVGVIGVLEERENGNRLAYVKWKTIPLSIGATVLRKTSPQYYFPFTFRAICDAVQSIGKLVLNLSSICIFFLSSVRCFKNDIKITEECCPKIWTLKTLKSKVWNYVHFWQEM
jgi:hypothetical protein